MWALTADRAHANKAIQILNAWSSTLTTISGADAILAASLDGFKFANAAEIMRYTNSGWAAADVAATQKLLTGVFYPVIQNFATFANGNWSTGSVKAMMANSQPAVSLRGAAKLIDAVPGLCEALTARGGGWRTPPESPRT